MRTVLVAIVGTVVHPIPVPILAGIPVIAPNVLIINIVKTVNRN